MLRAHSPRHSTIFSGRSRTSLSAYRRSSLTKSFRTCVSKVRSWIGGDYGVEPRKRAVPIREVRCELTRSLRRALGAISRWAVGFAATLEAICRRQQRPGRSEPGITRESLVRALTNLATPTPCRRGGSLIQRSLRAQIRVERFRGCSLFTARASRFQAL